MAYKIFYIDDNATESRENDLKRLDYNVKSYDPSSDLSDLFAALEPETDAVILDYRLTKGENNACFDAPTIAQTLRTKHKEDGKDIPLILMSNEDVKVAEYDKDFTSQDLFDFVLTKEFFTRNMDVFKRKLNSFIESYQTIKTDKFDLLKILKLNASDKGILHSHIFIRKNEAGNNIFKISSLIYDDIIRSIGVVIGEDVLSARLGISKKSSDWNKVLESLNDCSYSGVFSDVHNRWWMKKVTIWWKEIVKSEIPLQRLDAEERVDIIKKNLLIENLIPVVKTKNSNSSNFWTICKHSQDPIDPFDGIELLKDYLPWQEKEYLSLDSALRKMDFYKDLVSPIDKKAIRDLVKKESANE